MARYLNPQLTTVRAPSDRVGREAIRQFLEDREDYLRGLAVLERHESTISLTELERRLGVEG